MEPTEAVKEYLEIVPESYDLLRDCIGLSIRQIAWHDIPGTDLYGRLLETLELQFDETSIFLRTPRHERAGDGDPVDTVEFAFRELPFRENASRFNAVSQDSETAWQSCIGSEIRAIELLADLKDSRFARYYGIRFQLHNEHSIGYHYQWGEEIGDWVNRHPKIVIDGFDPPPELGWRFVHWI